MASNAYARRNKERTDEKLIASVPRPDSCRRAATSLHPVGRQRLSDREWPDCVRDDSWLIVALLGSHDETSK